MGWEWAEAMSPAGRGYVLVGSTNSTDIPGVTNSGGSDIYFLKLE